MGCSARRAASQADTSQAQAFILIAGQCSCIVPLFCCSWSRCPPNSLSVPAASQHVERRKPAPARPRPGAIFPVAAARGVPARPLPFVRTALSAPPASFAAIAGAAAHPGTPSADLSVRTWLPDASLPICPKPPSRASDPRRASLLPPLLARKRRVSICPKRAFPPRAAVAATEHQRSLGADLSEPCSRPSPPHLLFAPPLRPDRPATMPNQRSKSPFRLPTEPCLDPPSPVCETVPLPGTRDEARHGGTPSAAPRRGTRN